MRLMQRLGLAVGLALGLTVVIAAPAHAQKKERIELKFGTLAPDNTPWSDILKNFKKELQKSTRGQIRVKNYLNGVKGDEAAMLQMIKFGQLTGGGFTSGGLSTVVPEMQVLEIPYLFNNDAEADFVMDEIVKADFQKLCADRGLHLYIWAVNGWHDFGSTTDQLVTPEDFDNVKTHMQETDSQRALLKSLGANPV
ncbi:MAG: TRAP transporter substrate-binding protein DctP, partial [Planctomycetota bacterium]